MPEGGKTFFDRPEGHYALTRILVHHSVRITVLMRNVPANRSEDRRGQVAEIFISILKGGASDA